LYNLLSLFGSIYKINNTENDIKSFISSINSLQLSNESYNDNIQIEEGPEKNIEINISSKLLRINITHKNITFYNLLE